MSSSDPRRTRVTIPGSRILGWRSAWLRTDAPHDLADPFGTLAESVRIRDVVVPAGSVIAVNPDFHDINVHLAQTTIVRGIVLPARTTLTFRGRMVGFPGLRLTVLLALAMPWLWWQKRRYARVIEAVVDRDIEISGHRFLAGSKLAVQRNGSVRQIPTPDRPVEH